MIAITRDDDGTIDQVTIKNVEVTTVENLGWGTVAVFAGDAPIDITIKRPLSHLAGGVLWKMADFAVIPWLRHRLYDASTRLLNRCIAINVDWE